MISAFPNNDVERALLEASQGRLDLDRWLDDFADAVIWVPLTEARGQQGSFPVMNIDGGSFVPVFTSAAELAQAAEGKPHVTPRVREFVESLPDAVGLAVNPGGTVGLPIPAATLRQALGLPSTISSGTTIRIGEPAEEPQALLTVIASAFADLNAVQSGRRCWAAVGESRPGLVLGVDVDPDSPEIRSAVLSAVRGAVGSNPSEFPVDVVFDNDRDEFTKWMQANVPPFYSRSGSAENSV